MLAKTSNPSSGDLQDMTLVVGGSVADRMAQLAETWGADTIGAHGYGNVGIVVGATCPETAARLRGVTPHALHNFKIGSG
ncbi:MAG: hypothetical protein HQL95_05770 [Magnetococcales bacterium]|nr:hypothetical protein [Magnetococcales bacterium]